MKRFTPIISKLRLKAFLVINFGTIAASLLQVHCQGHGGNAASGGENKELVKETIEKRHGDNQVDKLEYSRILPNVLHYMEDKEGSAGYKFSSGMDFWSERSGGKACYYATVAKMNSAGVPIRIYSVLIGCDGEVLNHELVL